MVIPLVTSHAPMLGRTLLYTALTRARRLLVVVGQKKALHLAVRDWRRTPRQTALGGLLDGTRRFGWGRADGGDAASPGPRERLVEPPSYQLATSLADDEDGHGDGPLGTGEPGRSHVARS